MIEFEKLQASLAKVMDTLLQTIPSLLTALLVLLLGWLFARLISRLLGKLLRRIGLDKLGDRLNNTEIFKDANITVKPVIIFEKFVYWTFFFVTLLMSSEILGLDLLSKQISALINYIPDLLTALVILAVGFLIADAVKKTVANTAQSFGIPAWRFLATLVFVIIMLIVSVTALEMARVDTQMIRDNWNIILAGLMLAFAVAYGIAARRVLSNVLTSYYSRGNFQLGQKIELDGHVGTIVKMDKISFTIDTGEHFIVFPMERLLKDTVIIHRLRA